MPYEISWLKQNEVMYIRMIGKVTLAEMEQIARTSIDYVNASSGTVHAITDALNVESIPYNIPALAKDMGLARQTNSGFTVIVSSNKTVQFVANTLLQILRMDTRIVSTLEEAYSLMRKLGVNLDQPAT